MEAYTPYEITKYFGDEVRVCYVSATTYTDIRIIIIINVDLL